jgi:hypothetical protein
LLYRESTVTIRKHYLRFAFLPAAALMIAAAAPASAQYHRWGPDVPPPGYGGRIHPQHIEAMVRSMGYQPVAEPRARGPLWVTHAVDRNGQHVRVLIDSFTGRVIDVLQRPVPPRGVAITPPPNLRTHPDIQNAPRHYPPQAAAPESDYDDDDGPDYDYRDQPPGPQQRQFPQQPQYNPQQQYQYQQRPNTQQGPAVIPYEPRSNNDRLQNNQNKTATSDAKKNKSKAANNKDKKNKTATVDPEKKNMPAPKARPQEAPQNAQNQVPAPEMKRAPEPVTTGSVPPVQPLDPTKKNETPSAAPPVQPLL